VVTIETAGLILAGTGHRPDKLGGYGADATARLVRFAQGALLELRPAKIISGMALGWDQALAKACVLEGVPFDAYVPFLGQESVWPKASQERYKYLLGKADLINYVCEPGYAAWKMQSRNGAMARAADVVLALWNGSDGGTANCVKFAKNTLNKPVLNVWDRWVKGEQLGLL
jgi:predicted Rossmann fold nucleotide-binding protein DprA/Smf involved in DNA uptake